MACPQSLAKIKVRKWCFSFPPKPPHGNMLKMNNRIKDSKAAQPSFFQSNAAKRSSNAQTVIIPHVYSCCTPPNALIIKDVESDS